MASLQKKGESWYCQFTYERQRHSYPIGKVEESEANATAARIDYILMRIRQRLLEVPTDMDIVTFIQHDGKPPPVVAEKPKSTPFSEFRQRYIDTFSNGAIESNTLVTAKIHLSHIAETLGKKFALDRLKHADLQRHIDRRRKDDVTGVTIKKEIDTFRAAWNWACRMGIAHGTFPSVGLVYPKGDDKLPFMTCQEIERRIRAGGDPAELWECLYLTDTEITELLDHVQSRKISPWVYPAFVVAAHAGARRSEIMRAKPEDVDLAGGTITIREKKRVKGRRSTRRIPLSNRLTIALTAWLSERESAAFLFGPGSRIISAQAMTKGFARGVKDSKLESMRGWHVLRHSFISALASRGVDQRLIDDFVGHQTEEQRRRYRHLYPSTQQDAIKGVFG